METQKIELIKSEIAGLDQIQSALKMEIKNLWKKNKNNFYLIVKISLMKQFLDKVFSKLNVPSEPVGKDQKAI